MGAGLIRAAVVLSFFSCSFAYYLPGTYPQEFFLGQTLQGTVLWVWRIHASYISFYASGEKLILRIAIFLYLV